MLIGEPLLQTKLNIPIPHKDLVVRTRLLNRLAEGFQKPLTLVVSPAGYGKTTLVAEGTASCGFPAAWLSLDKADNRWERFARYLLSALKQIDPRVGRELAEDSQAEDPALSEKLLSALINDLDQMSKNCLLVLDDYQVISNQTIHESISFLLEHCPRRLHLVIITRSDPPIPLARLRAGGQLVELRASDLRFTGDEARQFLNEGMRLNLDPQAVFALTERTEGWAAGLQMASIALQAYLAGSQSRDAAVFIERFSGTNRYILDYLLEEVLVNQSQETQQFLLFTAVLDRFCAPLCDALQAAPPTTPARAYLDMLEKANLFIVGLDDERVWYRYHPLFADLLRSRLDGDHPGMKTVLHQRAADWFERVGLTVEAVNHALAANSPDQAARLVEENTTALLVRGELNTLMHWVEVLPEEYRRLRPKLCIHQAYALSFAGKLQGVEPLLQQAETCLLDQQPSAGELQAMKGMITAVRAMNAVMAGRIQDSISLANQAREMLPADQYWDRATAAWALGYAERMLGHLNEAKNAFAEMVALARKMENIWTLVSGLMDLANIVRTQGQLTPARLLFAEALEESKKQDARNLGYIARLETGLAHILYEQNELSGAQQLLTNALTRMHRWPNPNHQGYAYAIQARLSLALGDIEHARQAIDQAVQVRDREALVGNVRRMIEVGLVRVWLTLLERQIPIAPDDSIALQCASFIKDWHTEISHMASDSLDESTVAAMLMTARIAIFRKQVDEVEPMLNQAIEKANRSGNVSALIEAHCLAAVAGQITGGERDALLSLEKALNLAFSGGYMRSFLDEGRPLQLLLAHWLARSSQTHLLRPYASSLLVQFNLQAQNEAFGNESTIPAQSLPEPLSQREVEVLSLMAQGLTNPAIARMLILSTGTVKAHTAAIYRKLDVANRTEAVARARQLHILP